MSTLLSGGLKTQKLKQNIREKYKDNHRKKKKRKEKKMERQHSTIQTALQIKGNPICPLAKYNP